MIFDAKSGERIEWTPPSLCSLEAAAVVAAVVSAGAAVAGGMAGARGHELEAQQYKEEAENARVAAEQDEAARRRDLSRTLATQEAIRAGRGVELFSGTGMAIRKVTIADAERDINTSRLNYLNKQRRYLLGAAGAKEAASGAMLGGIASAAGSLGTAASGINNMSQD